MQVPPRGRVLIVDDEDRVSDGLREYLSKYLLYTRTARSVRDALHEIAVDHFDVIVLDWILPDGDGRGVLEFASVASPETVTIVYSAHRTSDAECTAVKAHHFVEKSLDTSHIRNAVERGLAQRSQTLEKVCLSRLTPLSPHQALWKTLRDFLPAVPVDCTQLLVTAGDGSIARGYASWLLREIDGTHPVFEVDAAELDPSSDAAVRFFLGECSLGGNRPPSFVRGLLDSPYTRDVIVHDAQELSEQTLRVLADTLHSRKFHRLGSDRELDLQTRISLTANGPELSRKVKQSLADDRALFEIAIPDSPLSICDSSEWIKALLAQRGQRPLANEQGVMQLFGRIKSALSWDTLRTFAEMSSGGRLASPISNWVTTFPFFESTLRGSDTEGVSSWKAISDIPRLIYVSWILDKTMGNVAEAARLSGLTRAAIYAVIRDAHLDPQAFRPATP